MSNLHRHLSVLPAKHTGFTLIEVMVALAITAIALTAGLQASGALTRLADRQSTQWLAQLCAENALAQMRLHPQMPALGNSTQTCEQAGTVFVVNLQVSTTPNPSFRKVLAAVSTASADAPGGAASLLQLTTIVGRF
jgi:general secretion pathway protein I